MACARIFLALFPTLLGALCVDATVLYHGTSSVACTKIATEGFIPSLSDGKQHTAYGEGVYFSADQTYAARLATRAIKAASGSMLCKVLGMFCEIESCIVEIHLPDQDPGTLEKWWSSAAQYDESYHNYASPLDWVQGDHPGVFTFKKQGLDRLEGSPITLRYETGTVETANFRVSPYVYFDFDGKTHVRKMGDLLSLHERAKLRGVAYSYVESSVGLLMDPIFHGKNAALGMLSAMSGCADADMDCVDRLAEGALVGAGGGVGGLVGQALGGISGSVSTSYITAFTLYATGAACPWCIPVAAVVGGSVGAGTGARLGEDLGQDLGRSLHRNVIERILTFIKHLFEFGDSGMNEALSELGFSSMIRARNEIPVTATEIVTQKRKLLLQHHPDKCQNTDDSCHEKSIKINVAAEFLLRMLEESSGISN